jgi:hypothetical protein
MVAASCRKLLALLKKSDMGSLESFGVEKRSDGLGRDGCVADYIE